ncbi:uncharacterized protein LOC110738013 [Chenopodium quinoa]|uniref:uncharacterized protein LOC110738013 n=1 Tax=Chenopodium quinoa TaxID=63459 RepID=UPI000B77DB22|nr:uncharacterized protein LOC110738013 [Chenopodium quinoa]
MTKLHANPPPLSVPRSIPPIGFDEGYRSQGRVNGLGPGYKSSYNHNGQGPSSSSLPPPVTTHPLTSSMGNIPPLGAEIGVSHANYGIENLPDPACHTQAAASAQRMSSQPIGMNGQQSFTQNGNYNHYPHGYPNSVHLTKGSSWNQGQASGPYGERYLAMSQPNPNMLGGTSVRYRGFHNP